MMITLDLNPEVHTELAAQARARGMVVEAYIQDLLLQQVSEREGGGWDWFSSGARTPQEAGRDIVELRQGVTLGGLKLDDLIHEGHRY